MSSYPSPSSQLVHLAQALTNMLMNSIIHGFKDRKSSVISLKLEQQDIDLVGAKYHDNGIGLTSNQLEHFIWNHSLPPKRSQGAVV